MTQGRTATDTRPAGPTLLDIVVLGGGGHVGLPLSLAFANAGLRVGIYDVNGVTLERIGRGEMPFLETGADELLPEVLASGRLELGTDAEIVSRADAVLLVIGTPVDEFLGPSMRSSSARSTRSPHSSATARSSSCGAPSTRGRPSTSRQPSRTAGSASTSPSARSGSPRATRSRSSTRCPRSSAPTPSRPAIAPRRCSAGSPRRPCGRAARKPSSRSCSPTPGAT